MNPSRKAQSQTQAQSPEQCPVPSQAQLALAIAIVNSKPANVSAIDHIQQIRLHIKQTQNHPTTLTGLSDKYFDSVAFWKQAYTKAEDEQSKLNDRVYELEQRIEVLKLKLKPEDDAGSLENGKRKGSKESGVPESQKKRQKTNNASSRILTNSAVDLECLNELISQEDTSETRINSVMRHLSVLHQSIQKRPNWSSIYLCAVDLCKATSSIIQLIYNNSGDETSKPDKNDVNIKAPNPMAIITIIEASHTILCCTLNKAMSSTEGAKYEGQIIYHMTCLFEAVLHAMSKLCNLQAASKEYPKAKQSQKKLSRNLTQRPSSDSSKSSHCGVLTCDVSEALRRVLASMMLKATTLGTAGKNSLFEGYLYVFLNRVGTVLSVLEFREILSSSDLQASPDKLPLPEGLRRAGIHENISDVTSTAIAYEIEAYHLVWLLEKAVALVHSISMKASVSQEIITNGDNNNAKMTAQEANTGPLLRFTKKKLQCTLLKAVFHEDEVLFLDSLAKPQNPPSDDSKVQMNKESESVSEWYLREVWRLLGWDILESIWKENLTK